MTLLIKKNSHKKLLQTNLWSSWNVKNFMLKNIWLWYRKYQLIINRITLRYTHIHIYTHMSIHAYVFLSIYSHFPYLHFHFQAKFLFRQVISSLWTSTCSNVKWRRVSEVMTSNVHHSLFHKVPCLCSGYWRQMSLWIDQLIKIIILSI